MLISISGNRRSPPPAFSQRRFGSQNTKRRVRRPGTRAVTQMAAVLVALRLEEVEQHGPLLTYAITTAKSRVFLYLTGSLASEDPTPRVLDFLALCYNSVAHTKPMFDLVPLFPAVGWTPEKLAELAEVEELVAGADHVRECNALLDKINTARERLQLPSLSLTLTAGGPEAGAGCGSNAAAAAAADAGVDGQAQQEGQQQAERQQAGGEGPPLTLQSHVLGGWRGGLRFRKVAVGGTFDRLHAGHRLLLAATALVSTSEIFVGVTAQKLLLNKANKDLLEPYEARAAAAVNYMKAVNPGLVVVAGPLNDPNEPPIAATDPDFEALVVSEETIPGADAINRTREQLGFKPLTVVVVGLIASQHSAVKLSSTDLRLEDAQRASSALH